MQTPPSISSEAYKLFKNKDLDEEKPLMHEIYNYAAKCIIDDKTHIEAISGVQISEILPNTQVYNEASTDHTSSKKKEGIANMKFEEGSGKMAEKNLEASGAYENSILS